MLCPSDNLGRLLAVPWRRYACYLCLSLPPATLLSPNLAANAPPDDRGKGTTLHALH